MAHRLEFSGIAKNFGKQTALHPLTLSLEEGEIAALEIQLADAEAWKEDGYRIVRPQAPGQPVPWKDPGANRAESTAIWHYVHPLHDLIGGLGDAGFEILRFGETWRGDAAAEPGSQDHLAAYLPPFFTLLARCADVERAARTR